MISFGISDPTRSWELQIATSHINNKKYLEIKLLTIIKRLNSFEIVVDNIQISKNFEERLNIYV